MGRVGGGAVLEGVHAEVGSVWSVWEGGEVLEGEVGSVGKGEGVRWGVWGRERGCGGEGGRGCSGECGEGGRGCGGECWVWMHAQRVGVCREGVWCAWGWVGGGVLEGVELGWGIHIEVLYHIIIM